MDAKQIGMLIAASLLMGACDLYYPQVSVSWTVDGATDATICDRHGIDSWVVEIVQHDALDYQQLDCRNDPWSGGLIFDDLAADNDGSVTLLVVVDATDRYQTTLASKQQEITAKGNFSFNQAKDRQEVQLLFRAPDFGGDR